MKLGRLLPWLGAAAALLLLVNVNALGARFYRRWDFTSDRLYTLSVPTRELLASLTEPVDVVVLLSKSDPLQVSVHQMLETYAAATSMLRVRYVDPDRSPAEFLAVQQKYGIQAGRADDGRIVTDAVLVLARGDEAHWFVTADEIVRVDEDSGRSRPALEQALSSALDNLRRTDKAKICFTTGQREPTLDDAGPEGLSELRQKLLKNNYDVESVDATSPSGGYSACTAVVVPTPELEFGTDDAARLTRYVRDGGNVLLLLGPTLGESARVRPSGLESLLEPCGVRLDRNVVLEQDAERRLPSGSGELFFAKLLPHAVTRGVLHEDDKLSSRVLIVQARSLEAEGAASLLMESSASAVALDDLTPLRDAAARPAPSATPKSYGIAAACELPPPAAAKTAHGPRVFVTGASNLAWNRNFQDPSLYGNRRLIENALSWAAARPSMLSVPEKPEREVGLSLSQDSLAEVMRYVLFYMPAAAGLLGAFVLLRRRSSERESRREKSAGRGESAN